MIIDSSDFFVFYDAEFIRFFISCFVPLYLHKPRPLVMNKNYIEEPEFRIKTYSKRELACLYLPETTPRCAMRTFIRWIRKNRALCETLKQLGCNVRTRTFTPRQVQLIVETFDVP